jgi:hypothetical protein
MSSLTTTPSPGVAIRQFTVDEFDRMIAAGILTEDERVELIDGVIVAMTPIGDAHASCVLRLNHLLNARLRGRAWVQVQGPIRLHPEDPSRPEPDLTVVRPRSDYYRRERPRAADILLVIEVADTSAERDRLTKLPKYARAGIGESWVVDLEADGVLVGREPQAALGYASQVELRRGERVIVPGFPDVVLTVDEVLGPSESG